MYFSDRRKIMNIGIETNRFANTRWGDEYYKKIKSFGFDCADFNMADTETFIYTASQAEADAFLKHERQLAENAGIKFSQVHGPWRWPAHDYEEADRAERMEKMKKSIRFTSLLGCKNWVVHPIMPHGIEEKSDPKKSKETWDINIIFMTELLKTAKEYDIVICLENMPMPNFSIGSYDEILKFVKTINDDNFKICLDTGHVSVYDDMTPAEAVRTLGNEIRVLHVHDNKFMQDLHLIPYFGIINWQDFSDALKEIHFDGVFNLETTPPGILPDEISEKMYVLYAEIAKNIIN